MASTSIANIQERPSRRITKLSPSEGNQTTSLRMIAWCDTPGYRTAMISAAASAVRPASQAAGVRAEVGRQAAATLPAKGRIMLARRSVSRDIIGLPGGEREH